MRRSTSLTKRPKNACAPYLQVPEIERLRWLDELVRFTLMFRQAPLVEPADAIEDDR